MTRRVYLSGPMTGIPDYNYPAFHAAAAELRAAGHHVESPAEPGIVDGWTWADYLRRDIAQLVTCDAVSLLPGWAKSRGARLEVTIAQALGMDIYRHPALLTDEENYLPATVLREGRGDRATPSLDRGAA